MRVAASTWEDEWEDEEKHGFGKFTRVNGEMYEGQYENDEKNGHGKYTWADGEVYEGNWTNTSLDNAKATAETKAAAAAEKLSAGEGYSGAMEACEAPRESQEEAAPMS